VTTSTGPSQGSSHFAVLDGWRGLAAIVVCYGHATHGANVPGFVLAVDFFFVLSGFVIARSYGERMANGTMPFTEFVRVRLIRLYPMLFVSTLLAFVIFSARILINHETGLFAPGLKSFTLSLFLLPNQFLAGTGHHGLEWAWPLNLPSWSLFFELIANFVWAAIVWRFGYRNWSVAVILLAIAYGLTVWHLRTTDFGDRWDSVPWGFARIAYSFAAGLAVYQLYMCSIFTAMKFIPSFISTIILLLCFFTYQGKIEALQVVFIFPLLVLAGAHAKVGPFAQRFGLWLGAISYPLYLIHWPLVRIFRHALSPLKLSSFAMAFVMAGVTCLLIIAAHFAFRYYDLPVRRALTARFKVAPQSDRQPFPA
jgi:peptidoglycan/LPS O-acetylase OafA/YrhL